MTKVNSVRFRIQYLHCEIVYNEALAWRDNVIEHDKTLA